MTLMKRILGSLVIWIMILTCVAVVVIGLLRGSVQIKARHYCKSLGWADAKVDLLGRAYCLSQKLHEYKGGPLKIVPLEKATMRVQTPNKVPMPVVMPNQEPCAVGGDVEAWARDAERPKP